MMNSGHRYQAGHPWSIGLASLVDCTAFYRKLGRGLLHNGLIYGEEFTSD